MNDTYFGPVDPSYNHREFLYSHYLNQDYVDTSIVTSNGSFKVHSSVVSQFNGVFKDLITNLEDAKEMVISLPQMKVQAMRYVIEYIYRGRAYYFKEIESEIRSAKQFFKIAEYSSDAYLDSSLQLIETKPPLIVLSDTDEELPQSPIRRVRNQLRLPAHKEKTSEDIRTNSSNSVKYEIASQTNLSNLEIQHNDCILSKKRKNGKITSKPREGSQTRDSEEHTQTNILNLRTEQNDSSLSSETIEDVGNHKRSRDDVNPKSRWPSHPFSTSEDSDESQSSNDLQLSDESQFSVQLNIQVSKKNVGNKHSSDFDTTVEDDTPNLEEKKSKTEKSVQTQQGEKKNSEEKKEIQDAEGKKEKKGFWNSHRNKFRYCIVCNSNFSAIATHIDRYHKKVEKTSTCTRCGVEFHWECFLKKHGEYCSSPLPASTSK